MTDTRTLIGRLGIWGLVGSLPAADARAAVSRTAELGYGALWVGEAAGRDPFAQLAALAEASGSMALGTSIVNIFGRDAMASRMGAMTLHELTGGRFALGLGVSHLHLVQKLRGHAYEKPLTRMREYLEAYERLPYRGPVLAGPDGSPTTPPVLIAALGPRMLELAATATDGTLPFFVSSERVAWMRDVLDDACPADRPRPVIATTLAVAVGDEEAARSAARAWMGPYARAENYQRSLAAQGFGPDDWEPPYSDRLVDAMVASGSPEQVRQRIGEFHAAGADHVAVLPLVTDRDASPMRPLEALAPAS